MLARLLPSGGSREESRFFAFSCFQRSTTFLGSWSLQSSSQQIVRQVSVTLKLITLPSPSLFLSFSSFFWRMISRYNKLEIQDSIETGTVNRMWLNLMKPSREIGGSTKSSMWRSPRLVWDKHKDNCVQHRYLLTLPQPAGICHHSPNPYPFEASV